MGDETERAVLLQPERRSPVRRVPLARSTASSAARGVGLLAQGGIQVMAMMTGSAARAPTNPATSASACLASA